MLTVQIDEVAVQEQIRQRIAELVKEADTELVFWDSKELMRRTCMSWNTIQKEFFFDQRFPKFKVGGKWYFPAQETKKFLLEWLRERR
ncbi:hypothetical protein [Thermicanus aegyptius]|uniref:hypothetical protein n=1 Tax=Thermicanus aegyptius TaxID=94009 RepID=UPI000406A863|nr:hypothetical protein [Thermicanus aegyptius]